MKAKQKVIIALASFAVCSVIFLAAVVYPVFHGVLKDYREVLAHKREILQLKEDVMNSLEFEMLAGQYEKEFMQLEELFVDSKIPIAFFRFLDETAARLGVQIEKSPGAAQKLESDRWPSFEVRVAGSGAYPSVMAFLQKIENAPYLLEVKTLAISTEKGFGREVDFSLSLTVFTKPL
ncbi:MAG TPA: hypothetical protein VJC15_04090 [Candidatus Paceibacterota bacterium]